MELNFNFPIVKDIDATKQRHQKNIDKLVSSGWFMGKAEICFLNRLSDDDLFERIMCRNRNYFTYYPSMHWREQKGVKEIKGIVNGYVHSLIVDYLVDHNMPKSWSTAYYLLHQGQIDTRMKSVSRLLYAELS